MKQFIFIFIALQTKAILVADVKIGNETAYENCLSDDKIYQKARQLECLLFKHLTAIVRIEK